VTIHYPEFGDFYDVAADILATTPEQIARFPNVGLAESALAAPRAGFGDVEAYPTILEKAAILRRGLACANVPRGAEPGLVLGVRAICSDARRARSGTRVDR